ncbi:MAG: hypothetical protein ACON5N_08065 [Akkermansiaceae bacterium]
MVQYGKHFRSYRFDVTRHKYSAISFRPTLLNGATHAEAGEHAKGIKIYSLEEELQGKIEPTEFTDATDRPYDCLPHYNMTFIEDINDVVQNNPIREKARAIYSMLQIIGIKKGEEFKPTPTHKKAALEGQAPRLLRGQSKITEFRENLYAPPQNAFVVPKLAHEKTPDSPFSYRSPSGRCQTQHHLHPRR